MDLRKKLLAMNSAIVAILNLVSSPVLTALRLGLITTLKAYPYESKMDSGAFTDID